MRTRACLLVVMVALAFGCGDDKDTTAPLAPHVDAIPALTSSLELTVHGSAEPGAEIEITGADGVRPAVITADRYTSLFDATVTLEAQTKQSLSFVAVDRAGNRSEATVVEVEHEQGHATASKLSLELFINGAADAARDPIQLAAGDEVRAVGVATDEAGHTVDMPVVISTSIPGAFVAGSSLSNIHTAGSFAIAATVAGASLAHK